MTSPRPDRRIERTKEALRDALIGLLGQKPWEDISVQDICDSARIGRSTFYQHHPHKESLLAAGLAGLRGFLRSTAPAGSEPFAFIDGLVDHVREQRQVFRCIVGRRSGHAVQRLFREMVEQLVREDLAALNVGERDLSARFITGGIVEALSLWTDLPEGAAMPDVVGFLRTRCLAACAGQ